jgi:N-acetylneuraminate lyase
MRSKFAGIWPALLTPLAEDGSPNLHQVEKLVELFIDQQLDGLYVLGSTGQWPLLRTEERQAVAERVMQTAGGRIPVIVHVGAATTEDAVDLARHAAQIGADGISSVAPIYYAYGSDAVFEHYRRIGAASELPFFIYHLARGNQPTLDPHVYAERLLALPHVAGMKITDPDLHQFGLIHTYTGNRLTLFSGLDELMCQAAVSGAAGAIGTFYNLWGKPCQKVRQAFVAGDFLLGRQFMLTFQQAIAEIVSKGSIWGFLQVAMRLKYAIEIGKPRPPLGLADPLWKKNDVERLISMVEQATPVSA